MRTRFRTAQNFASASLFSPPGFSPLSIVASGCSYSRAAGHPQSKQVRRCYSGSTHTAASRTLLNLASISEGSETLTFQSTSNNPYHNLSIEDYLLRNSDHSSRILFFYTNRPCVVIGRNQNPWLECNLRRLQDGLPRGEADDGKSNTGLKSRYEVNPIDFVRRRSGGGTVFHDVGNLNYSVIVPNDKDFNRRTHAEMVVRGLNSLGGRDLKAQIKVNERHDIVMQRWGQEEWLKISGSAFKLTRGRALHHGTLLYSSPYLNQISGLLRSPARDLIQAKGVESVRSKVGNLKWMEDAAKGQELESAIVDNVTAEFLKLYGQTRNTQPRPLEVSDQECRLETNVKIADGVNELMSNDWRFGQTPRFDFDSGMVDGSRLQFHSNRGLIETWKLGEKDRHGNIEAEGKTSEPTVLHDIHDWKSVLQDLQPIGQGPDQQSGELKQLGSKVVQNLTLMKQLKGIFPTFTGTQR